MKYKKQIVMICLITFLFLPMSGKYEEPKAEVLLLSTGAIIACAALATAAGVIITNPDMLQDVGERIYYVIKDIPNAIQNVGDNVKINVTRNILDSVISICNNLPVADYIKNKIQFSSDSANSIVKHGCWNGYINFTPIEDMRYLRIYYNGSLCDEVGFQISAGTTYTLRAEYIKESSGTWYQRFYDSINGSLVGGNSLSWATSFHPTVEWTITALNSNKVSIPLSYEYGDSVCIPYTEKNTESVSADKPKEYFPVGSGSISVPIDTPLSNYNPSVDNPISLPTDLVGDGISADVDTSTDTGSIDKPNVDVGETPTTGDSLWDTLLSWLSSLFAPLVALLEWIGSILTSILDFLGSLVSSLVDAIVSLFAPTVAVDELFSIPEGSGFSDILSLFDWGLFDIEPKPYEFVATLDFMSLVDNTSNPQVIEIKLFDNELVKKYLPYVRNILSYSLLISTISMIVWHFIPKRDID